MKLIHLSKSILVATLVSTLSSCSYTLTESDAAYVIREDIIGRNYKMMSIPKDNLDLSELKLDVLKKYEDAGAIIVNDTIINISYPTGDRQKDAIYLTLTDRGKEAIIEESPYKVEVFTYKYVYDDIIDIRLIDRVEDDKQKYDKKVYLVFYRGQITEISPFAVGIKVGDRYPFDMKSEPIIAVCKIEVVFVDGEFKSKKRYDAIEIKESEIEQTFKKENKL